MLEAWVAPWREALEDPGFRVRAAASAAMVVTCTAAFSRFVNWADRRAGVVLPDPILASLPVFDLSWVTFGVLYAAVAVAIFALLRHPRQLVFGVAVWSSMLVFRLVSIYITPLDPPAGIVPLVDPFASLVFGSEQAPTRDLFFSGHTSTITALVLTARSRRLKLLFVLAGLVVVPCLLLQRVHYSVDVFAAPFVVFAIYKMLQPVYAARAVRSDVRPLHEVRRPAA